ncbi:MAG TPA: O-antigen ligase family protein [Xanthobacteraceae bacterium]|nr:O-antigen ligase family protein [Xanthobacteraceae bacterium]
MPATPATSVAGPLLATESLRGALLWLMGFSGAFVFIEPSPYEIVGLIAIVLFVITGLSLRAALVPLVLLLVLLNVGYASSVVQVSDQTKPVIWVMVSAFLATTAVFYAAMLGTNTQYRLDLLMRGYLAAALVASLVGVAAYFRAFGGASDLFLLYSRARGTFNDPNVLGAFLVLPGLVVFQRMLAGRLVIRSTLMLLVMLAALLLSFSRAAWGVFLFAAVLMMGLTFLTSRSVNERLRIVMVAVLGLLVIAALVVALLSVGQVADLFKERAALEQSYDVGRYGRFGRYLLGAEIALEHPFGIGPLQFAKLFVEDPHNTFLNAFMSGGWFAGFAYLTLSVVTVVMSTRFLFVRTPWQPTYHAVYAAYLGVVAESVIIDIDHWRHYFLILGVLWGLMAASRPYLMPAPAAGRAAIRGSPA